MSNLQPTTSSFGLAAFRLLVSFLCVFGGLCVSISAQDFKTIHDGVEYAEVTRKLGDDPVKINLLRLDLTKVRLDVHHAMDAAIGTEKTSSIAIRHGAVAAINAGFFRLDTSGFAGEAAGILQIDEKLLSDATSGRIALLISNTVYACTSCSPEKRSEIGFEHLKTHASFTSEDLRLDILGINRERREDDIVLYTAEFAKITPSTISKVLEIIIRNRQIKKFSEVNGGTDIPRKGYVLSVSGKRKQELLSKLRIGKEAFVDLFAYVDKIRTPEARSPREGRNAEDIVAGVPQLIKYGKIDITWEQEKASKAFVETRHPRTAVAKMKDGKFLMITVDGRQPGVSVGMNLNELAEYLLGLGAVDAMNLDGGGSTTMFLDGKVVNKPSDKEGERKVSDAILVTLRKKK